MKSGGDSAARISELRIIYRDGEEVPEQIHVSGILFRLHEVEAVGDETVAIHAFYLPLPEDGSH